MFDEPSGNFCLRWFKVYGPTMKLCASLKLPLVVYAYCLTIAVQILQ